MASVDVLFALGLSYKHIGQSEGIHIHGPGYPESLHSELESAETAAPSTLRATLTVRPRSVLRDALISKSSVLSSA